MHSTNRLRTSSATAALRSIYKPHQPTTTSAVSSVSTPHCPSRGLHNCSPKPLSPTQNPSKTLSNNSFATQSARMSTMKATHGHNEACCNIPPVVSSGYKAKGAYEEIDGKKTYVTGSAKDAKKGIIMIMDIFVWDLISNVTRHDACIANLINPDRDSLTKRSRVPISSVRVMTTTNMPSSCLIPSTASRCPLKCTVPI